MRRGGVACALAHELLEQDKRWANRPSDLLIKAMHSSQTPDLPARSVILRTLHILGWSALCCAYLAVSLPKLWPVFVPKRIAPAEPFYSLDAYLEAFTQSGRPSARILRALASLPRDKAVILFVPNDSTESKFIALSVIYLSWPREVRWLATNNHDVESQLQAMAPSSLAAVIFWNVTPPSWLPAGIPIGRTQVLVPVLRAESSKA
jgi:hypothetical protein